MSLADDFATLRASGKSDDEILKTYQKFDPQHDSDISQLMKQGAKPKDILENLAKFKDSEESSPDPMANKGVVEKAWGALQYGASTAAQGLAETSKQYAGEGPVSKGLSAAAQMVAPTRDYVPASKSYHEEWQKGNYGNALGYIPRMAVEGAPRLATNALAAAGIGAMTGGVGAIPAFIATDAAQSAGNNVREVAAAQGRENAPTTMDRVKGAGLGLAEGALNRLGLGLAAGNPIKSTGIQAVKDIAIQGAKGAAGDAATSMVSDAGHQAVVDGTIDPDRVAASGAAGFAQGAAVRAAHAGADVNYATKYRDIDRERLGRLADRLDNENVSLKDEKSSYEAIKKTENTLKKEASDAMESDKAGAIIKSLEEAKGGRDDTKTLVRKAQADLADGNTVNADILTSLRSRLGDFPEGHRLVSALEDHNTLNEVKQRGRWDDGSKKFGAGLTNSVAGDIVNPLGKHGKMLDGGGLAAAAFGGTHGALSLPFMYKLIAGQTATYAGMRGLDKVMGNTNIAGQLVDRFAGQKLPGAAGPEGPTFREQEQTKADGQQALLAQQAADKMRELQVQRAFAEKSKQDAQAQQAEGQQDKLWNQREITPEQKAAQEEAMWAQQAKQEPPPAPATPDWSDHQAQQAIRDATLQRVAENLANAQKIASAKKKLEQNKANEEARTQRDENGQLQQISRDWKIKSRIRRNSEAAEASQARTAPEATNRPAVSQEVQAAKARVKIEKKAAEPKKDSKSSEATSDGAVHKITYGRHVVERSGVRDPQNHNRAVRKNLEIRDNVERDMLNAVPKKDHEVVKGVVDKWNHSSKSFSEAYHAMEDAFNDHFTNNDHLGKLYDIFNKHESALRTTWKN